MKCFLDCVKISKNSIFINVDQILTNDWYICIVIQWNTFLIQKTTKYYKCIMDKIVRSFWLNKKVLEVLSELSKKTGKTQTKIIEEAILQLYEKSQEDNTQLELAKKQNEQLQITLQSLNDILQ